MELHSSLEVVLISVQCFQQLGLATWLGLPQKRPNKECVNYVKSISEKSLKLTYLKQ